jgi:hypothetical protein
VMTVATTPSILSHLGPGMRSTYILFYALNIHTVPLSSGGPQVKLSFFEAGII